MDGVGKPFLVETGSILMIERQKAKSNNSIMEVTFFKDKGYWSISISTKKLTTVIIKSMID